MNNQKEKNCFVLCSKCQTSIHEKDVEFVEKKGIQYMYCKKCYKKIKIEYKISDLITLKLENSKTNIYINEILFQQCKYILLNFTHDTSEEYDELISIDDIINKYSKRNETNKTILNPEEEFFGHCSNLEAWINNNYSLDVLHSSLSFPLLSRLVDSGDKKAQFFLKEEILRRIERGDEKVVTFFLIEGYLGLFSYEELELLFHLTTIEHQKTLKQINKLMIRKWLIEKSEKKGHQKIIISRNLWKVI